MLPGVGDCVALTEKNDNGYLRAVHPLKARLTTESVLMKSLSQLEYPEQKFIVLGPMPPRIAKLSNKFRYRLIVKCRNTKGFRSMIETLLTQFPKDARFREVTVYADLNPENIY